VSDMCFAIAVIVGGACSRARWSHAETSIFSLLGGNWPLLSVFDLQSSFQMQSNFCSVPKILTRTMPAFADGEN